MRPTLRLGSSGGYVEELQRDLGLELSGDFDSEVETEVTRLQGIAGYLPDGVVGPMTWGLILSLQPANAPSKRTHNNPFKSGGVEFAPFEDGGYWPVRTRAPEGRTVSFARVNGDVLDPTGRRFMAPRWKRDAKSRWHTGCDLYGYDGDIVVACYDGVITNHYDFYAGTSCTFVDHGFVSINYGEVESGSLDLFDLSVGHAVVAGQPIGRLKRMRDNAMLHCETYANGVKRNKRWYMGESPHRSLLNPTTLLMHLAEHGE
jgi:hypothetical protein